MKKMYFPAFIKTFLLVLLSFVFSSVELEAQTAIINTGTAGAPAYNAGPIYRSSAASAYDASRYTYLYTASELSAAGITSGAIINLVGWVKNNSATSTGGGIFRIYMKNSAAASFANATETWANLNSGATLVYENLSLTVPATATPTYIDFPLTTSFTYTGGSLEISTEWDINQVTGSPSTGTFDWLWSTVADRIYGTGQTSLANAGTLSSTTNSISTIDDRRPFIKISYGAGSPCVNPPTAGTVTSSASAVCMGVPFTLTSTGGTSGTGQSVQWQSSPDGTTWTNIVGANSNSLTTTQSASTYYRLVVTCGVSVNSNSVQVSSPAAVFGTFTINNAVATGGTNFNSFNDAYDYIKCGISGPVVFNVVAGSGPYTEQLIMTEVPGASSVNTVTFNGNGRILNYTATNTNERAVIKLNGADHIIFDSLVINALGTATTEYGFGIQVMNNADSNIIRNCSININTSSTSTNYAGIVVSASATSATGTGVNLSDYNVFDNNTITGGYYGFTLVGSATDANGNNRISNNKIRDFYTYGLYVLGSFNVLVEANEISRPTRTTVTTFYGIYFTSLSVDATVTRNRISDPFGGIPTSTSTFYGIYFTGVDGFASLENKVINNVVGNLNGNGDNYGIYNTSSDNVWYYHNTLNMDGPGTATTATTITRGFYQTTLAGGIEFRNNIITVTRGGLGTKYAIYFNTITSTIFSDNNDLFIPATTAGTTNIGFYTSSQATLANWQAASSQDANSVSNNPLYADATNGNFTPTNASINNLGTALGVLTDFVNAPRSASTPDLGAYEFSPGACVAPPTAGAANVSETPVCVNTLVALGVTGNSTGTGQTYQWQSASAIGGPYTNISGVLTNPAFSITSGTTSYYRLAVTCSGNTVYSTPVLLTVNPALPAGTYSINSAVPTGGTNYISFNAAKAAMNCGIAGPVIFNVAPGSGPYTEQLILDSIAGTSAINTVTFNGNGNKIQFNPSVTGERAVVKLRMADHIIFDSLQIDATLAGGTYGYAVQLFNNADSNIFRKCTITSIDNSTSTNYAGIVISGSETSATTTGSACDGNLFDRNIVSGGYYAVTTLGSTTVPVTGNIFTGNSLKEFYSYGFYLSNTVNTVVEKSMISRPTRSTVTTFYGIYVTAGHLGLQISKNRIRSPFGGDLASTSTFYGIYFTGVDASAAAINTVSNNLVYDVNGDGIQYGFYNTSSSFVNYYHNTISLDDISSSGTSTTRGFYQTTLSDGIAFKNNIITVTRGGTGIKHAVYFATSTSTIVANNNNYYVNGAAGTNYVGYYTSNQATLADWQTASGQDANSISLDPIYANPSAGDFSPLLGAIDNLGVPVGISTDIRDAVRSATTPDIGAFEFAVPPCVVPPTAGTAVVSPNSGICLGTTVVLNLTGNSIGSGQTYQWQSASSAAGPWTNIGPVLFTPYYSTQVGSQTFFRAAVTCTGNTTFSTTASVVLNPAFLSGFYTINPSLPATLPNFQSFVAAVSALDCGITGFVTFDVAPGTYTEQVRMHSISGTSAGSRVTFRSANGIPSSVVLNFNATNVANNYVLKLDSASFISYQNMTITALNSTNGRVVEIANTASNDSISNCVINAPVSTSTSNVIAGIYADMLKGSGNVIKGNMINNGSAGIYLEGTAAATLSDNNVIDSNTVNNFYYYGIYTGFQGRINVTKNTVNVGAPSNTTVYGMYNTNSDSAFQYVGNKVNINGSTATTYGMYFTACNGKASEPGRIANNTILANTGNTGTLYGMYNTATVYCNTVNNVISINTSGVTSYGSYSTGGGGTNFYNNSIVSNASSATNNVAAYFAQTSGAQPAIDIRNNIFSHLGGGRAMYVTNLNFIYSDYNTFYTTGTGLIQWNAANIYPTLQEWRDTSFWDLSSIAYRPALLSSTDLRPDVSNPDVWAIHGRGVQIAGNNYDFNNASRPTTLTTGVPDMGAYEFLPTAQPTVLTAIPAVPVAGGTQTFMYGTDTVTKITYNATAPVPASVTLRRYSGVIPPALAAGQQSMYYYTDMDVPAQGAYKFDIKNFYVDSWQGFIPSEPQIKLGRTNAANAWVVNAGSRVNEIENYYQDTAITFIDKFTGLTDGTVPPPPPAILPAADSSNRGTRFWVGYGHHQNFSSNSQDMILYFSAEEAANVTVKINGTGYVRTYSIPANTVATSQLIPKSGLYDARLLEDGKSSRGISIESDVPIVAYAHIYASTTSEAAMLLPVGTYGYEYTALTTPQNYASDTYSWFYVVADNDSTKVQITPSNPSLNGSPAGVPFDVYLNKGEIYQVLGAIISGSDGYDMTGSKVKSISNNNGKCYPVAVFSGSSRTNIGCVGQNPSASGDNIFEQNFPSIAWGRKYLVAATSSSTAANSLHTNIYRVAVKDPTTIVKRNGVTLTGLVNNFYYQFESNTADVIDADKPVIVAQIMASAGFCPNTSGGGDPSMVYVSPVEQGIKRVGLYRNTKSAITTQYLTLIIPTAGVTSLRIDGSGTFDYTYPHLEAGYTVVVKRWSPATNAQVIVQSDSAFTAITYGLGSVESYAYNAGTLVKNLAALPTISNTLGNGTTATYTCAKTPFRFNVQITSKPTQLVWKFSAVSNLTPNIDVVQNNPVPVDSVTINSRKYYKYTVPTDYRFTATGTYYVPILITDPSIEGCNSTLEITLPITVIGAPVADFTQTFSGCVGDIIQFNGTGVTANGVPVNTFNWAFGDATTSALQNPTKLYAAPGTYNVNLKIIAADGCLGDTTKPLVVNPRPVIVISPDSIAVCGGDSAVFRIQNPITGATYRWYDAVTGGNLVFTGPNYTVSNINGTVVYYAEGTVNGCTSVTRKRVTATILPLLTAPVATLDSAGSDFLRFKWLPVPNAVGYQVSINAGTTWLTPSSGPTGLTHTVNNLQPLQTVSLIVRALGGLACQTTQSAPVSGKTLTDDIYIPNSFTPNGDGLNDVLQVYGYVIKSVRFTVFNQWGEKIAESANQANVWDGTVNGKKQPSGVYMYVCQLTLRDGSVMQKKGSVNLIR